MMHFVFKRDSHSTVLQINEKDMDTNIVYSYSLFLTALANHNDSL